MQLAHDSWIKISDPAEPIARPSMESAFRTLCDMASDGAAPEREYG